LDDSDKASVLSQIGDFFSKIKSNKFDFAEVFKSSVTSNLLYIALVFILGISIIGIPIVIIMLFLKGFMIGFSIASIIAKYKIIGLLGAITYIFPHIIISAIVIFVISYYALKISFSILKSVIEKKTINFSEIINRYSVIMLIGVIAMVISSLIETFISPYIMKLFTLFI
jgi:stage II sporulation protein M